MENPGQFADGPIRYTIQEKVQVIKWYWGPYSVEETCEKFFEIFPGRPVPCANTIFSWSRKLESEGCLNDDHKTSLRPARKLKEEIKTRVCAAIEQEPMTSTRALANVTNVPRTTVPKILKENNYHPYKVHFVQSLLASDSVKRLRFCQQMQELIAANLDIEESICVLRVK